MSRLTPGELRRAAFGVWVSALAAACAPSPSPVTVAPAPSGPIRHVIVVTIDGLMPEAYLHPDAHGLKLPVLRRLVAEGASSDGALSVFPTVTYPAHTSIASAEEFQTLRFPSKLC